MPLRVRATARGGTFELSVANEGDPLPPAIMEALFQPLFRGTVLYIASGIASPQAGAITAPAQTRFTFSMPAGTV
jgi:signal transduction histidine kinase